MLDHEAILKSVNDFLSVKMRKDRLYAFGSLALFIWISMTYFLFVHKPNNEAVRRRFLQLSDKREISQNIAVLSDRVSSFEQKLKRTSLENQQLLLALKEAVKESQAADNVKKVVKNHHDQNEKSEKKIDVKQSAENVVIAVLMFACNRVTVAKALDSLLAYRKDKNKFPIIVSQDCGHGETAKVIQSYGDVIKFIQQPDQGEIPGIPKKERKFTGYFKIAR